MSGAVSFYGEEDREKEVARGVQGNGQTKD